MRGLDAAAWALAFSLAPVALAGSAVDEDVGYSEIVSTAFATVNVPRAEDGADVITLRLDVEETDHLCGRAHLKINNQTLFQNAAGSGNGPLTIPNGPVITASWNFTCENDGEFDMHQFLSLTIHSLDGEIVPDITLGTHFRQTYPVRIIDIAGAAVVSRLSEFSSAPSSPSSTHSPGMTLIADEMQQRIHELDLLRMTNNELQDRIAMEEAALLALIRGVSLDPEVEADSDDEEEKETSLLFAKPCDSLSCLVDVAIAKLKYTVKSIQGLKGVFANADSDDCNVCTFLNIQVEFDDGRGSRFINDMPYDIDMSPDFYDIDDNVNYYYDDEPSYLTYPDQIPLLMTLAMAAILFSCFALWAIHRLRDNTTTRTPESFDSKSDDISKLQRRQRRQERRAHREARRQAIQDHFVGMVSLIFSNRGISAEDMEKRESAVPERQPSPENTMEQELAGFREAASMVDDLIAAEEGRRTRAPRAEDDAPPAYEDEPADAPRYDSINEKR